MSKHVMSLEFYGKTITVETGELAKQANGSVLVRYDDTVILSTAVAGKEPKDVDFFPLTVTKSFSISFFAAERVTDKASLKNISNREGPSSTVNMRLSMTAGIHLRLLFRRRTKRSLIILRLSGCRQSRGRFNDFVLLLMLMRTEDRIIVHE